MAQRGTYWVDVDTPVRDATVRNWGCISPDGTLLGGNLDNSVGVIRTFDNSAPDFELPSGFTIVTGFNLCNDRCLANDQTSAILLKKVDGGDWSNITTLSGLSAGGACWAASINGDGTKIVGTYIDNAAKMYPVMWVDEEIQSLGTIPGLSGQNGVARWISGDGSTVVGFMFGNDSTPVAFVWNETDGMQSLKPYAETRGANLSAYKLHYAVTVSGNGKHFLVQGSPLSADYTSFRNLLYIVVGDALVIEGFNPIVIPDKSWEETAVYEPMVIYEDGMFKMWYGGGWDNPGVSYATSLDGSIWTKHSTPVIGQGGSSISGNAARISVTKVGSTYYGYYSNGVGSGADLKVVTSLNGIDWTFAATALSSNVIGGINGWANTTVWKENTTWYMLVEGHTTGAIWQMYALSGTDGLAWTFLNSSNPLTTLQVAGGGMYGGAHMPVPTKVGGLYHIFYHASPNSGVLPTNIYYATSPDLITWTITPTPVLTRSQSHFEMDQVADPCVVEVRGKTYLFYDGDDNPAHFANIGLAIFDGTLSQYFSGGGTFTRIPYEPHTYPVEFWSMAEALSTRKGSVHAINLTDHGGVAGTTGVGNSSASLFTGSQYLDTASSTQIQLGNFDFTFAGWVYITDHNQFPAIVTKYDTGEKQLYLYVEPSAYRVVVYTDLAGAQTQDLYATNFGVIPNNTWHFVVLSHDAVNNILSLSVDNGTPNTVSYDRGIWPTGTAPLRFGGDGAGSSSSDRHLQRWGFWKRLLTTTEISSLYLNGQSLIEWWPLSESSGSRRGAFSNLTLTNHNSVGGTLGINDSLASKFVRGSHQYLSRADEPILTTDGSNGFEFCFWVRTDSLSANSFVLSKDDVTVGPNRQFVVGILTSGALYCEIENTTGISPIIFPSTLTVTVGTWHMVNFWFDTGDSKAHFKLDNGTSQASTALGGTFNTTGNYEFEIGAKTGDPNYSDISVNRVGWFNRLLTSGERTTLYNSGSGVDYPF